LREVLVADSVTFPGLLTAGGRPALERFVAEQAVREACGDDAWRFYLAERDPSVLAVARSLQTVADLTPLNEGRISP
jgi:hypothetical protein